MNDRRQVCGRLSAGDSFVAFVWTPRAGMTALGSLPLGGIGASVANAIDDCGQVVGTSFGFMGLDTRARAFVWQDGELRDLGALNEDPPASSYANDIDAKGTIVGSSTVPVGSGFTQHAFATRIRCGDRTEPELVDLGVVNGFGSTAMAINARGDVVGSGYFVQPPLIGELAVFGDSRTGGLLELPMPAGSFSCNAKALNDQGVVAGACSPSDGSAQHVVLWSRTRTGWSIEDRGTVPGMQHVFPTAVDEQGRVFGWAQAAGAADSRAFVSVDGSFHFLDDLLVTDEPVRVTSTGGINHRGDLATTGIDARGEERAFLLLRVR